MASETPNRSIPCRLFFRNGDFGAGVESYIVDGWILEDEDVYPARGPQYGLIALPSDEVRYQKVE